jgi:hypothetical protein
LQDTTIASVVAAVAFLGAYGNSLRQLRFLKTAATTHAGKAASAGTRGPSAARQDVAGGGFTRQEVTFNEFMRQTLPLTLVHSQALAVSVVFSGFVHGAINGYVAERSDEKTVSK